MDSSGGCSCSKTAKVREPELKDPDGQAREFCRGKEAEAAGAQVSFALEVFIESPCLLWYVLLGSVSQVLGKESSSSW